jgi:N6-L-threonylcarbamoyladenine synthase
MKPKLILGIETSCDDTSLAILSGNPDNLAELPQLLAHLSFSQDEVLRNFGGVVPEIAARNHMDKIIPTLKTVLNKAQKTMADFDQIAVTAMPGLVGPLLTGINIAKTLALFHPMPINPINHLYAHLEAIYLTHTTEQVPYPYLGVLVSGGHSLYLLVRNSQSFEILGSTIDDAAGEAFDKGGRLLGLHYPAGKIIDDLAKQAPTGSGAEFNFPIPLKTRPDADLSFSGLKTSLKNLLQKNPQLELESPDGPYPPAFLGLLAAYQETIVDTLIFKLLTAEKFAKRELENSGQVGQTKLPIVVGGGVACNSRLRSKFKETFGEKRVFFVSPAFCTDNGAMIANYALRTFHKATPFPTCLDIEATGRFIPKGESSAIAKGQ